MFELGLGDGDLYPRPRGYNVPSVTVSESRKSPARTSVASVSPELTSVSPLPGFRPVAAPESHPAVRLARTMTDLGHSMTAIDAAELGAARCATLAGCHEGALLAAAGISADEADEHRL